MGLGKTVIGIAAAEDLLERGDIKCCLIVCPASLKYQWAERIAQFTDLPTVEKRMKDEVIVIPEQGCYVVDGNIATRNALYGVVTPKGWRPHYIIMGYDNVINDANHVRLIKPDMVILDEATAIKTFKAKRTKQIKKMLKVPYRMALTGTPVENRPDELFSIMQWVDESVLGRYDLFDKAYIRRNNYGWVVGYKNLPVLRKRLSVALSRRSREDPEVKPYLPDVDTGEWYTDKLSPGVRKLYKKIAIDMLEEMDKLDPHSGFNVHEYYSGGKDESTPSGKLMAMYMCLEMLLDHPDLIIMSAQNGAKYANSLWQAGLLDEIWHSMKLNLLSEKVQEILEYPDSKILIFSFYKGMLDIMEDEFGEEICTQFHGGMSQAAKSASVARFSTDSSCRIFLSSHAGAYGIDMSMADYLINYDLPWSSGKADQINGRHVRVSSEFAKVYVRNILVPETVEPRKLSKIDIKRRLASATLDGHGQDEYGRIELDSETLRDHLTTVVRTW